MVQSEFNIYVELYKRKEYSVIPIGEYPDGTYFYMTPKQIKTLELLTDSITSMIGYGGSARSGKSIIECTTMIFDCYLYADIAWGLARKELTILKRTVLLTLFKQFQFYGFYSVKGPVKEEMAYNYNEKLNKIIFYNKSDIFLIDSKYQPSDPLNTRFGGFELTKCAIDESNETALSVVLKLYERTGWRNNDKYGLKRKLFECFNPAKNHVFSRYFKPFKDKVEEVYKKFIPALPGDNPHPAVQEWVQDMLQTGDEISIQRQIYGNFEYDDDPSTLLDYDALCDVFTNSHVPKGIKRISADLAMQGRDRFVAGFWEGLICTIAIDQKKSTGKSIEQDLKQLKTEKQVSNTNIIADADGLGDFLESYIKNIVTFRGGQPAIQKEVYANIKSECAWMLTKLINTRKIQIICTSEQQEAIKTELSVCLKRSNVQDDLQKKKLLAKKDMMSILGHSPDYLDMLIMGMYPIIVSQLHTIFNKSEINWFNSIDLKGIFDTQIIISTIKPSSNFYVALVVKRFKTVVYITDIVYTSTVLDSAELRTQELINKHGPSIILLIGGKISRTFSAKLKAANPNVLVWGLHDSSNKIVNIVNQASFIKKYFYFTRDYVLESDYHLFVRHTLELLADSSNKEYQNAGDILAIYAQRLQKEFFDLYIKPSAK